MTEYKSGCTYTLIMRTQQLTPGQAKALRSAIDFPATELRQAEASETKAEIRARKQVIRSLELQLTGVAS